MKIFVSRTFPFLHVGLSVNSVVASFTRASEKLRALGDHHGEQAEAHRFAATNHGDMADSHDDESERAHGIADRIDRLVGA